MKQPRAQRSRRLIFWSFLLFFGGLTILFLLGLVVALAVLLPEIAHPMPMGGRMLWVLCLVPLGFFLLAGVLGGLGFRRVGRPVGNILGAIDAVADGDLSVRLDEHGPRPLRALAKRFNHMTVELGRAEQQRRNMTADIAHELRTPLHIIQGNLEGMLDGVYAPDRETLTATLEETRLLGRLVADLQTLSLAEAGQLPLHPAQVLVADLLADVCTSFSAQAAAQGVLLQAAAVDAGMALHGDHDRLDQVLSNLVVNALRFTPAGGRIDLAAEADAETVRITVRDTGSGIPPEALPYVFDRFWKGDRARTRAGTGSGLGLAIARQLVRAHGGSIEASSQVGQGTVFTIALPRSG